MENPATWGEAEKIVQKTLDAVTDEIYERGPEGYRIGLSVARRITDALRDEGLLPPDNSGQCGHCCDDDCALEIRGYNPRRTRELILEHAAAGHPVMAHWRAFYDQETP